MQSGSHLVAKRIINKLGGARAVSLMLGVSVQAVYKWLVPIKEGGCGGLIPVRRQIELMVAAAQRGIKLTPDDFFPKVPDDGEQVQSISESGQDMGRDNL
jgi:DNA invertase Pin-like site-specific DNA recombinase